jgi:hypothetical protein
VDERVVSLDKLTGSTDWPDRWMTAPEVLAEMERRGVWDVPPFAGIPADGRLEFLFSALRSSNDEMFVIWAEVGGEFKNTARLTDAERETVTEWYKGVRANAAEQMQAVLDAWAAGTLPKQKQRPGPRLTAQEGLAKVGPIANRVRELAVLMGWHREGYNAIFRDDIPPHRQVPAFGVYFQVIRFEYLDDLERGHLRGGHTPPEVREIIKLCEEGVALFEQCDLGD